MAKFKVGDRVRYVGGAYKGITGKVGMIIYVYCSDYAVEVGGKDWILSDDELEPEAIAVPLPAKTLLAGFGQTVPARSWVDGLASSPCGRVTPKIEPVCPSCGCKDARNYVGFSSIECANSRCVHYKELANG